MKTRFYMKRGFTIVELLMVIGIIGILMGIVTTAASSSMKMARVRKAEALCSLVQAGLAVYHAQEEKFPIDFSSVSSNSSDEDEKDIYTLNGTQVRDCVRALAQKTKDGNPVMDVSGLFVSRSPGEANDRGFGLDFMAAIHGTRESSRKMKLAEMYFGYPESSRGYFRRFKMTYAIPTDTITVSKQ